MPVTHVVQVGECCATLAKRYGLVGWKPIVEHGPNAALFAERKNPHVLKPGDVVEVEVTGLGRLTNRVAEWDVDLAGPGDQLEVSANTLHVALAMPEDEAERVAAGQAAAP